MPSIRALYAHANREPFNFQRMSTLKNRVLLFAGSDSNVSDSQVSRARCN